MNQRDEPPNVFHLPDDMKDGMTIDRYREIESADAAGVPLDLSDEEKAEYEEVRESLQQSMQRFQEALSGNYKSMFERLNPISTGARGRDISNMAGSMKEKAIASVHQRAKQTMAHVGVSQETLDSIAEAKRLEHDREERNSENITVTARVMQDMLVTLNEQARDAATRDAEAKTAARKNFWVAFGSLVFAALAVIVPFVIEAIKGWN